MRADDTDASDIMSNGHEASSRKTRFEAIGDTKLQKLRDEAAEMVASGVLEIDDIALDGHVDDSVILQDGENDAFRDSVRDELGGRIQNDASNKKEAEHGEGWGPTEVDFTTIWDEYNFPEKVSDTQLVEALAVSRHTGFKKGGARRAIRYGVESGRIIDIPRHLPDDAYGDEMIVNGVMYALGGDA